MAFLFSVEDKSVRPTTEALLISPFKDIWERDDSKQKMQAIAEMTYIEFMTSQKKTNPYKDYSESVKEIKVREAIFADKEWTPDELVIAGINLVNEFQAEASSTYRYYMSAKAGAEKLEDFFNNFEMNEVNPKNGNPVYKPRDITSALKDTEDVLSKLNKLKTKVEEELFDKIVTKAGKETSVFADPESLG